MRVTTLIALLLLAGCGRTDISAEISRQAEIGDGSLDLSKLGGPTWDRVCFFGPYTTNANAEKALGFTWDVEKRTAIKFSDGINVLVFVAGRKIATYIEHPRRQDFWTLSGQCLPRSQAALIQREGSYVRPTAEEHTALRY